MKKDIEREEPYVLCGLGNRFEIDLIENDFEEKKARLDECERSKCTIPAPGASALWAFFAEIVSVATDAVKKAGQAGIENSQQPNGEQRQASIRARESLASFDTDDTGTGFILTLMRMFEPRGSVVPHVDFRFKYFDGLSTTEVFVDDDGFRT